MLHQRGRLTLPCLLPVGDFLAHGTDWTGLPAAALLRSLRGATPVSAGGSAELERLVTAIRRDAGAARDLDAPPAEAIRRRLCRRGGEVGAAASEYVDLVGHRVVAGYDIVDPCALEVPELLVETVRGALAGRGRPVRTTTAGTSARACPHPRAPVSTSCGPRRAASAARGSRVNEHGLLTDDFRDFMFANAVRFWGEVNPDFFRGTAVEKAAAEVLVHPAAR